MRIFAIAALLCAAWNPTCLANQFSQMFRSTTHDFGTVAKAAKTEYRFVFENPYSQPIHVRNVRTSCGCTTPIIETEMVPPGGQGSILAKFNTGTHSGARSATVTVTFDQPNFGEVQLNVKGYIRTDVVFQPGEVSFGSVSQGESKSVEILVDYAGKPSWQITNIRCDEKFIEIDREEISRQNGRIQYAMKVRLKDDAPVGPLETEIVVQTNDRNLTTVPLRLTATVQADISVSPNMLSLGDISRGEMLKQVVILKADEPFRVLSITSDAFEVQSAAISDQPKALHTLPLILEPIAGQTKADGRAKIFIETDHPSKSRMSVDVVYRLRKPETASLGRGYGSLLPYNPLREVPGESSVDVDTEATVQSRYR